MRKNVLLSIFTLVMVFSAFCQSASAIPGVLKEGANFMLNKALEGPSSSTQTPSASNPAPSAPSRGMGIMKRIMDPNEPELKVMYNATEVAKFRADCEALIKDAPTGGKQITFQQLQAILNPYRKGSGKGNTDYHKYMMGQFEKQNNKWVASGMMPLAIHEKWSKAAVGTVYASSKNETLHIKNPMASYKEGAVESELSKEDASYTYKHRWYKTAETGTLQKIAKVAPKAEKAEKYTPGTHEPGKMPDMKVTLYPDATVAGQLCKVYSYDMGTGGEGMKTYFWFSTVKGMEILQESMMTPGMTMATFTYDNKKIDKDELFFDPSKQSNVAKWIEK